MYVFLNRHLHSVSCVVFNLFFRTGRGGATNSHSGNRAFRALVKKFQGKYLQAKKRDKPAVASKIVEIIRQRGGRFLRRCDNHGYPYGHHGHVYYVDIGGRTISVID